MLIATLGWLLLNVWLVPPLLRALYEGTLVVPSEVFEEQLSERRQEGDFELQLARWQDFSLWAAAAGPLLLLFVLASSRSGPLGVAARAGTARELGILRAWVGVVALIVLFSEDLVSTASLPRSLLHLKGWLGLLEMIPGVEQALARPGLLWLAQVGTVLALAAATLGWRTRGSLAVAALGYFLVAGLLRSYTRFFHAGLIPLYLLLVLALAPSGDGFSLDRRRRRRRGDAQADERAPSALHGWPIVACWTALVSIYLFAGLSKLRSGGAAWITADSLRGILLRDSLQPMDFDFDGGLLLARAPAALLTTIAAVAVLFELSYASVLFSARARRLLPPLAVCFHLTTLWLQNVLFLDLILLQAIVWRPLPRGAPLALATTAEKGSAALSVARARRRARAVAALLVLAFAFRAEFFPHSAMQMYAHAEALPVEWHRARVVLHAGGVLDARLPSVFPALRDARYRWALADLLGPEGRDRRSAVELAQTFIARWNEERPHQEIRALEVARLRSTLAAGGELVTTVAATATVWEASGSGDGPERGRAPPRASESP